MVSRLSGIVVAFLCASQAVAQVTGSSIQVPRGAGIMIDGNVDDAEWRNATRLEQPAGTVVRLLRDAGHLYLGITSERQGFASLCVATNDDVHVLHASAALGAVTYRPNGDMWQSADTAFRYAMRNTALDDAARAERASFLNQNGWVASTVRMGNDSKSQEIQIALDRFPLPLSMALGRWLITEKTTEWWPATISDHEGCFSQQLVRGYVPQRLLFKPKYWLTVEKD